MPFSTKLNAMLGYWCAGHIPIRLHICSHLTVTLAHCCSQPPEMTHFVTPANLWTWGLHFAFRCQNMKTTFIKRKKELRTKGKTTFDKHVIMRPVLRFRWQVPCSALRKRFFCFFFFFFLGNVVETLHIAENAITNSRKMCQLCMFMRFLRQNKFVPREDRDNFGWNAASLEPPVRYLQKFTLFCFVSDQKDKTAAAASLEQFLWRAPPAEAIA